jgi:hypothetical protein
VRSATGDRTVHAPRCGALAPSCTLHRRCRPLLCTVLHRHRGASTPGCTGTEVQARCLVPRFQVPHRVKSGKLTGSHIGGVAAGVHPVGGTNLRRANGGAVPARTQRSLKNRGPGRLGCGQPRLPRLHRGTEGGRRATWGATASPHAQGPRSLADQSGACLQAAGCSLHGPGDNAVELPRPGQTGPLPLPPPKKARHPPGIDRPSKIHLV